MIAVIVALFTPWIVNWLNNKPNWVLKMFHGYGRLCVRNIKDKMSEIKKHAPDKKSPGMEYESGSHVRYQFYKDDQIFDKIASGALTVDGIKASGGK